MRLFDKLYAATEEATKKLKKPFVEKKVMRALDGAVDSYDQEAIDVQEKIDGLMAKLANGNTEVIKALVEAELELEEIELQKLKAITIRGALVKEVAEEK